MKRSLIVSLYERIDDESGGASRPRLLNMFFEISDLHSAIMICQGALRVAVDVISRRCFCVVRDGDMRVGHYFYNVAQNTFCFRSDISVSTIVNSSDYRRNY